MSFLGSRIINESPAHVPVLKIAFYFVVISVGSIMLIFAIAAYEDFVRDQDNKRRILELESYVSEHSLEDAESSKLNELAGLYRLNFQKTQNIPRSIELYRAAILQGDLESQYDLGFLLIYNRREKTEGMALIQAASSAGYQPATNYLAREKEFIRRSSRPAPRRPISGVQRIINLTSNCKSAVASRAPIPDKVSFSITSLEYDANTVKGDVDFMNQYGAWMPYRFLCNGNNWGEVSSTSVSKGYWQN